MFTIAFTRPYSDGLGYQSFRTIEEAERMISFYQSCGSHAYLVS